MTQWNIKLAPWDIRAQSLQYIIYFIRPFDLLTSINVLTCLVPQSFETFLNEIKMQISKFVSQVSAPVTLVVCRISAGILGRRIIWKAWVNKYFFPITFY